LRTIPYRCHTRLVLVQSMLSEVDLPFYFIFSIANNVAVVHVLFSQYVALAHNAFSSPGIIDV